MKPTFQTVGVVGTGAMGQGIAQIAAQAGSLVKLYDLQPEAVAKASKNIQSQWDKLLEKNRFTAEQVAQFKNNLQSASKLNDLSDCDLVIEAIVERLDIKKSFFSELEQLVRPTAVLVLSLIHI
jgi:3-hydroxybutyryl-CoA dehydrogenase